MASAVILRRLRFSRGAVDSAFEIRERLASRSERMYAAWWEPSLITNPYLLPDRIDNVDAGCTPPCPEQNASLVRMIHPSPW